MEENRCWIAKHRYYRRFENIDNINVNIGVSPSPARTVTLAYGRK